MFPCYDSFCKQIAEADKPSFSLYDRQSEETQFFQLLLKRTKDYLQVGNSKNSNIASSHAEGK